MALKEAKQGYPGRRQDTYGYAKGFYKGGSNFSRGAAKTGFFYQGQGNRKAQAGRPGLYSKRQGCNTGKVHSIGRRGGQFDH